MEFGQSCSLVLLGLSKLRFMCFVSELRSIVCYLYINHIVSFHGG